LSFGYAVLDRGGIVKREIVTITGRKFVRLSVPIWAVVIVVLFLVLPDIHPSAAEMTPAVNILESAQSASVQPAIAMVETARVNQIELVDCGTQFLPVGSRVKTGPHAVPEQGVYQVVLTDSDFESVEAQLREEDHPIIEFTLTPTGDAQLVAHTAELRGYYLCLVVDGQVVNCPILRTPLTNRQGTIELTGDATLEDALKLAILLHPGSAASLP
jgi:preprotein translocase subunit SecD